MASKSGTFFFATPLALSITSDSALAFVALNPVARFQDSYNAQRWQDVNDILTAIKIHQVDNGGSMLKEISDMSADLYYQIGVGNNCDDLCKNPTVSLQNNCVDLGALVQGNFLPVMPVTLKRIKYGKHTSCLSFNNYN